MDGIVLKVDKCVGAEKEREKNIESCAVAIPIPFIKCENLLGDENDGHTVYKQDTDSAIDQDGTQMEAGEYIAVKEEFTECVDVPILPVACSTVKTDKNACCKSYAGSGIEQEDYFLTRINEHSTMKVEEESDLHHSATEGILYGLVGKLDIPVEIPAEFCHCEINIPGSSSDIIEVNNERHQVRSLIHELLHTSEKYECDCCGKLFTQKSTLRRHLVIHTGLRAYKCEICCKCFTNNSSLQRHTLLHSGQKPYKCDYCGICFTQKSHLNGHSLIHTGFKPYKCEICNKKFTAKKTLKIHILYHMGKKPHKCHDCGSSFVQKANFKYHTCVHTGLKPHKCDFCSKCFTAKSSLRRHNCQYTGQNSFKCDNSDSSSAQMNRLSCNAGFKPYNCNFCVKSFTAKTSLKRHSCEHSDQNTFKCVDSRTSFAQNINLNCVDTGAVFKPYKCEFCGKSFTAKSSLKRHPCQHRI